MVDLKEKNLHRGVRGVRGEKWEGEKGGGGFVETSRWDVCLLGNTRRGRARRQRAGSAPGDWPERQGERPRPGIGPKRRGRAPRATQVRRLSPNTIQIS